MNREAKLAEVRALRERVGALESELAAETADAPNWPPKTYYATYHLLAGMVLGLAAGASSLLFNVIGSVLCGQHALELIRVYLTFPLGEKALTLQDGFAMAAGCCLYLGTGMILGIPFHLILSRFFDDATTGKRFVVVTILAIGLWLISYYGILSWLQPLLIDGRAWIVDKIPIYVAAMTHLVFGWTILLCDLWGRFVPPHGATERG